MKINKKLITLITTGVLSSLLDSNIIKKLKKYQTKSN